MDCVCRFYLRAEMGVIGMHFSPLGGIDCITKGEFIPGCPGVSFATKLCLSFKLGSRHAAVFFF